jgi:hypothetical protein
MNCNAHHKRVENMKTAAAKSKKTGKPVGRPKGSDRYLPEMGELVMKLGRDGASKTEMAAACDVARSTLDAGLTHTRASKEAMALESLTNRFVRHVSQIFRPQDLLYHTTC